MNKLRYNRAKKIWQQASTDGRELSPPADFELDVYKKMLSRFHVGEFYYYIFNLATVEAEFVSSEAEKILGYPLAEFTPKMFVANLHPEDAERFVSYEQAASEFFDKLEPSERLKYKISYDFRVRCPDGSYKWILQQVSIIQLSESGGAVRTLGVHTDITPLKAGNRASGLSMIGLDGAPSYPNILVAPGSGSASPTLFSEREIEILKLVLAGKKTAEIADLLCVSTHTISVHRKNILRKSGCSSFFEIGQKASVQGWL